MDSESRSLQNDFFNTARKERATVTVFLGNGKRLTGRLKSFDRFTLLLEGHQGEQIIFKHAISTVSACSRSAEATVEGQQRDRATPVAAQQAAPRAHD
jgi:host factor-I protein